MFGAIGAWAIGPGELDREAGEKHPGRHGDEEVARVTEGDQPAVGGGKEAVAGDVEYAAHPEVDLRESQEEGGERQDDDYADGHRTQL